MQRVGPVSVTLGVTALYILGNHSDNGDALLYYHPPEVTGGVRHGALTGYILRAIFSHGYLNVTRIDVVLVIV